MEELFAVSLAVRRFTMTLLAVFGLLAIVLAAVGIYGVISYSVSLRAREVGIRMALGAARADVLRLVLGQGLVLVGAGLGAGVVASILLTRYMASLLFQVKPVDVATTAAVVVLLAAVALTASYLPARRATKVDPMVALRYE
jgi:putative ABC transport system permease protein